MIRKEFMVDAKTNSETGDSNNKKAKDELMRMLDIAFSKGAILELKIIDGVDLTDDGKRFCKIRLDIVSNTSFEKFKDEGF